MRHVEGFRDDPLAGEGRIAVDNDRHALLAFVVLANSLFGPDPSNDERVGELEMRGIRAEGDPHDFTGGGRQISAEPAVILHIAATFGEILDP